MDDYEIIGRNIDWIVWCVTVFAALSMVSNVKFYSFKDLNLRRSVPFWAMLVIVMFFVVITIDQARVLIRRIFGVFVIRVRNVGITAISPQAFSARDLTKNRPRREIEISRSMRQVATNPQLVYISPMISQHLNRIILLSAALLGLLLRVAR